MQRFFEAVQSQVSRWESVLAEVGSSLNDKETVQELAGFWGLNTRERRQILQELGAFGEASPYDLVELIDGVSLETVQKKLRWADLLGLITPASNGCWRIDPVVSQILETIGS